ncbi:MAG TPA: hypothetical protein VF331_10250 [Polyangiales bacterium]
MDPTGRARKRAGTVEPKPREEAESIPPPARPSHQRGEYDPESLWDSETDDTAEDADSEGTEAEESEDFDGEAETIDDLDDWDHPLRRLKIN